MFFNKFVLGSVSGSRCGSVRTPDRLRGSSSQNSISEIWSNHEGSPVPREGDDSFPDVFQDGEEFVGSNRSRKNSILSRKGSVISRTGSAVSRKGSGMSRNGSHSSKIGIKASSKRNSVRCVDSAETIPENGAGNRELVRYNYKPLVWKKIDWSKYSVSGNFERKNADHTLEMAEL